MSRILVVGLNPAWQQIFTLPAPSINERGHQNGLLTGAVNRATNCVALASGKGMNAAKVLTGLGHEVSLLQVVAGSVGTRIVEACEARGIRSLHVRVPGETRTCATLLHDRTATEIIGPFSVTDRGLHERVLDALVPPDSYDAVLICGTAPAGIDPAIYGEIVARAAHLPDSLVIWDSVMGLTPEILGRVTWLKVNAEEQRTLSPLLTDPATRPSLLITDGAEPASVRTVAGAWTCTVPRLDTILNPALINPIGAGDTTTALLADGILRGLDTKAVVGRALAAASASCLDPLPAVWDPVVAARLEADVRWTAA